MIEISHKQAQHLIRQAMDRRLPEEQWAILQAHLESCTECRRYQETLTGSEHALQHTLSRRWAGARGPGKGIAERLIRRRERRGKARKFMGKAVWYMLAALLLIGWVGYRRIIAPPQPSPETIKPRPTLTMAAFQPTPPQLAFRGLVAYEGPGETEGEGSEIYLLNVSAGRADRSNLTQDPGNDSHPVWSSDGEWIAFLSDRSGKNEVYVMTVAGSRLTQLTSDPGVDWRGPLEWSADGKWIALTGQRGVGGSVFLYLVPVSGGEPQSIAYTRGAQPWARFSSSVPLLAFPSPRIAGSLQVMNVETGWTGWVTEEDNSALSYRTAQKGAFDWSLGGRSLVYVADGPYNPSGVTWAGTPVQPLSGAESMLRLSLEMDARGSSDYEGRGAEIIDRVSRIGAYRAVSWVPNSLQVASLLDADGSGCWTVRIIHAYNRLAPGHDLTGLCVQGGMEHSNWTSDGNWLVLVANEPDNPVPGIYALRASGEMAREAAAGAPLFERLADVTLLPSVEDDLPAGPELRVRPVGRSLGLNPHSSAQRAIAPTSLPPASSEDLPGWVIFGVQEGENVQIFRSRPDGSQRQALTASDSENICPRSGPDGKIAFLSDAGSPRRHANDVFVMDADGQNLRQLTNQTFPNATLYASPATLPRYTCPVWSPDGKELASFYSAANPPYLAIIPVDGQSPSRYLRVEWAGSSPPVWLPNDPGDPTKGADRLLIVIPQGRQPARLMEVDVAQSVDRQDVVARQRALLTGWDDAWGLTLSPDGSRLAAVLVYYNLTSRSNAPSIAQLRVFDATTLDVQNVVMLNSFDPNTLGQGGLAWLPDGSIGLVRGIAMIGSQKSVFERLNVHEPQNPMQELARVEDIVFSAAWIGNAGWVLYASESGLWALNSQAAAEGMASAGLLTNAAVIDLNWSP